MIDTIEILSTDLLNQYRPLIDKQKKLARFIGISMGWHYPLDWSWIINHLGKVEGKRILDAGAGRGVLQWYLAEQGAEVLSVDRDSRACLPLHIRRRYRIHGLRPGDLLSPLQMVNLFHGFALYSEKVKGLARSVLSLTRPRISGRAPGKITIYNQDLKNLVDIPSNSIDAIISVSALEHNPPEELPIVVRELERVLKPSGAMIVTLAAGRERDWFHEPSKGWCYTEDTLRKVFGLSPAARSNYDQYDVLFKALKECHELQDQLAAVYQRSNQLGMPGGKWDPQYQPVGIIKVKANGF
jgi:SAM-dependent methyltransferase